MRGKKPAFTREYAQTNHKPIRACTRAHDELGRVKKMKIRANNNGPRGLGFCFAVEEMWQHCLQKCIVSPCICSHRVLEPRRYPLYWNNELAPKTHIHKSDLFRIIFVIQLAWAHLGCAELRRTELGSAGLGCPGLALGGLALAMCERE